VQQIVELYRFSARIDPPRKVGPHPPEGRTPFGNVEKPSPRGDESRFESFVSRSDFGIGEF